MRFVWVFLLGCFVTSAACGQDVSRGEIFVGYSFLSADTNGLTTTRESIPYGANVSFVANFNQWVGAETNDGTYYKKDFRSGCIRLFARLRTTYSLQASVLPFSVRDG